MAQILLSAYGTISNIQPLIPVGRELAHRGHDVNVFTNAPHVLRFQMPGLRFTELDSAAEFEAFVNEGQLLARPSALPEVYRRHYLPKVRREFDSMEAVVRPGKTVLLANDAPGVASRLIAEKYRVPLISVMTYPSHLAAGRLLEELMTGSLALEINELRSEVGLAQEEDLQWWWHLPNHYIGVWPSWFARIRDTSGNKTSLVGFIYDDEVESVPNDLMEFLATEGNRVILVTGGSAKFAGSEFFRLVMSAARKANLRALAVNRQMADSTEESTLCRTEVPSLSALMPHVSAVVHHGGMGTISQALKAGVPQLMLADGGDRPENAIRVEELGVGKFVPRSQWSEARLTNALSEIVDNPHLQRRCKSIAEKLTSDSGLWRVCDLVERYAERVTLLETCAFRPVDGATAARGRDKQSAAVGALSAERRYLLAKMLRERR